MKTIQPTNGMTLTEDTRLEPGVYVLPDGLTLAADGITLDGAGAQLIGQGYQGNGLTIKGHKDITIKNLHLRGYQHGINAADCQDLSIKHCRITDTATVSTHGEPLDYWRSLDRAYGSGILLAGVNGAEIVSNDLRHQMIGLSAYFCRNLTVSENDASHNNGFGFYLYETAQSRIERNLANHCNFYEATAPDKESRSGACGFLLVHGSKQNALEHNTADLCANGFKLDGICPIHGVVPCQENHLRHNSARGCVQFAFSDIGNADNKFESNLAENANTGFWLDHVSDELIQQNTITGNRRAGVAGRNSVHCDLLNNTVQDNRYGVLVWQMAHPSYENQLPDRETSKFWRIRSNTLHHNDTAIRITSQLEPAIKTSQSAETRTSVRPHDHEIMQNVISDNRLGIQTQGVDRTTIKDNHFEINLLGDIKS
ncbi:right-handed parallel beta-helix repeat-containing protein [bacterium]|nr:right-handed parallel beta-helix repeat-containing protein [bacterium]